MSVTGISWPQPGRCAPAGGSRGAPENLLPFTRGLAGQITGITAMAAVLPLYEQGEGLSPNAALALGTQHVDVAIRTWDGAAFAALGSATAARQRHLRVGGP